MPDSQWSAKALDTAVGANFQRQDLSSVITLVDGPHRPVTTGMPTVPAKGEVHYWDEQNLIKPGSGAASYPQGARPNADAGAPAKYSNSTCNIGKTASVTDNMQAVWTGAGQFRLADGEEERMLMEAINLQTTLKTVEVLNELEWMHVCGDSSNPLTTSVFPGGQTDGLLKWVLAGGVVVTTGTGGTAGTSGTPVAFTESDVRTLMRSIANAYPTYLPDTALIAPEFQTDFNSFVGGGAGRPLVQLANNDPTNLVAGQQVAQYETGFGRVVIKPEPNLSPVYNSAVATGSIIFYNKSLVKHAPLINLRAEPLARIGTSVERMVTCVFAQEHRVPKHAGIIRFAKSAF